MLTDRYGLPITTTSQAARDAYAALTTGQKAEVVAFLKTLQVLPEDATSNDVIGSPTGANGDVGALVGGAAGAAVGGLTTPSQVNIGR